MTAHDELLEVRVEVEDLRRQMIEAMVHLDGVRARMGLVGFRLGELARQPVALTTTAPAGLPCAGEFTLNAEPEVATHCVAPPDDALSLHDDPPSRPA